MSGIYGLLQTDGRPVPPGAAAAMAAALAPFGPDGGWAWSRGAAALGQLQRLAAPGDRPDPAPLEDDGQILAVAARLDNREELLAALGGSGRWTDRDLVRAAFRRWGEDCPGRLYGDWQLAAWDPRRRILFLARDPWGNTGMYVRRDPDRIAFAPSLRALLALPGPGPGPDLLKYGQVLTTLEDGVRTPWLGIEQLPQAHALRWSAGALRRWRTWRPEALEPVPVRSAAEHGEAFLDVFGRAVDAALRSTRPVGASLSGGLDSGAVVALAAPRLAAAGRDLAAFTAVPRFPVAMDHVVTDEWALAAATARRAGPNVRHRALAGAGAGILASIRRQLDLTGCPTFAMGNSYWILELLDQARALGLGTVLTGQCGNATISWAGTGSWLPPLLQGDVGGVLRALADAGRGPWRDLPDRLLGPAGAVARHLAGRPWGRTLLPAWAETAIRPGFAEDLRREHGLGDGPWHPVIGPALVRDPRHVFFTPVWGTGAADWHETAARCGVAVVDPTADLRLVEFCLRTPDHLFRRGGEDRLLLRRALAGHLPPEVLGAARRGLQAADLGYRVLAERIAFAEALDQLEGSPLARHCLDLDRMRGVLAALGRGIDPGSTRACRNVLVRGMGVGLALLRHEEGP